MLDKLLEVRNCIKFVITFLKPVGIAISIIMKTSNPSNHIFHFYSINKMACYMIFSNSP
jgi:hypothetical protein